MSPGAGLPITRREVADRVVPLVGGGLLTGMLRSVRWDLWGGEHFESTWGAGQPVIFALWHGRLIPCSFFYRNRGLATLISQHRDGDLIARVVEGWWGYRAVRGSSSRGGARALRQIVRILRGGTAVAVTPDGPRGPRQKMKLGPLLAAQMAGVPIIPSTAGASAGWWLESWDRFLVPKPFSRAIVALGEPMRVPPDAGEAEIAALATELESRMNELTARVDAAVAS